jgi:hypothetical protein
MVILPQTCHYPAGIQTAHIVIGRPTFLMPVT